MPFVLPVFNLDVAIWRNTPVPPAGPADVITKGNLAWGRRVNVASTGGTTDIGVPLMTMTLLLPPKTDVRGDATMHVNDIIECPTGTARYYACIFVDDIGRGFANEHRAAVLVQTPEWPKPTP